jgi:hypothetical protein
VRRLASSLDVTAGWAALSFTSGAAFGTSGANGAACALTANAAAPAANPTATFRKSRRSIALSFVAADSLWLSSMKENFEEWT